MFLFTVLRNDRNPGVTSFMHKSNFHAVKAVLKIEIIFNRKVFQMITPREHYVKAFVLLLVETLKREPFKRWSWIIQMWVY